MCGASPLPSAPGGKFVPHLPKLWEQRGEHENPPARRGEYLSTHSGAADNPFGNLVVAHPPCRQALIEDGERLSDLVKVLKFSASNVHIDQEQVPAPRAGRGTTRLPPEQLPGIPLKPGESKPLPPASAFRRSWYSHGEMCSSMSMPTVTTLTQSMARRRRRMAGAASFWRKLPTHLDSSSVASFSHSSLVWWTIWKSMASPCGQSSGSCWRASNSGVRRHLSYTLRPSSAVVALGAPASGGSPTGVNTSVWIRPAGTPAAGGTTPRRLRCRWEDRRYRPLRRAAAKPAASHLPPCAERPWPYRERRERDPVDGLTARRHRQLFSYVARVVHVDRRVITGKRGRSGSQR